MKRRNFFAKTGKAILVGIGAAYALCMKVAEAADSWFYWPSYPSTEALRRHIATSSKHPEYGWSSVRGKSRSQLISMHDSSHFRRGNSAPLKKTTGSRSKSSSSKSSSSSRSRKSSKNRKRFKSFGNFFRRR